MHSRMASILPQRRTQFSSCDACRRSRVACDASKFGHQPGSVRGGGSCSRCSLRKQPCTFEWIHSVKKKPAAIRRDAPSNLVSSETEVLISSAPHEQVGSAPVAAQHCSPAAPHCSADAEIPNAARHDTPLDHSSVPSSEPITPQSGSVDVLIAWSSNQIFRQIETLFGLFIGRDGCPFVDEPTSDASIPVTHLFRKLDAAIDDEPDRQTMCMASESRGRRQDRDHQIERSLNGAIQSFNARWLPLVSDEGCHLRERDQIEEAIRESWRTTRKDMLKVVNRISYRSAFALYLFSQTPIPVGISEDEELDGISRLVCIQTALLHVQKLRERRRKGPSIGTALSGSSLSQAFIDMENRAYWAAVMWDTTFSLSLDVRTSLTSGLNGACSELSWRLVRTFLVGSFQPQTESWRTGGVDVSDEIASRIISAARVGKIYVWKNITSLKEGFREGVDEERVSYIWGALVNSIDIYKSTIRPLLNICERRLHFLDQLHRMGWYVISLRYCAGILALADAIETANRSDLLSQVSEVTEDAERECVNLLKFGTENHFTIYAPNETLGLGESTQFPEEPVTASFIAIDPHPDFVLTSVLLLTKAIDRNCEQGKIEDSVCSHLASILLQAFGQLPQSSKAVQVARKDLQSLYRTQGTTAVGESSHETR
ncbi:hypothetical protein F4810DRAFT_550491 [Camillea tinctor]|nr:hypothetical protein F4810DRAFT_550491 [Camillea tinctor]